MTDQPKDAGADPEVPNPTPLEDMDHWEDFLKVSAITPLTWPTAGAPTRT